MVGIQKVRLLPAQRLDRGINRRAALGGFGADGDMLAIGFVPNRDDVNAFASGAEAGLQLRLGLPRKPVAHSERVLPKRQEIIHHKFQFMNIPVLAANRHGIFLHCAMKNRHCGGKAG